MLYSDCKVWMAVPSIGITACEARGNLPARQGHKVNCPKGKRESPGGYPYRATLRHVIPSGTCEFRCFAQFILADAVYSHQASELRNTVMLRLRRVADMCSSKVSDTANRRTHSAQSASMRKKKSSAVPLFRSDRRSPIFAVLSQGKRESRG